MNEYNLPPIDTEDRNYIGGYFDWLCELINLDESEYSILIKALYVIPFQWILELDINRNRDGLLLREEFAEFYPKGIGAIGDTASVLEVLIGLSRQMDFILDDEDRGDRTRLWFWEFIKNLNLDIYTDYYIESQCYHYMDDIEAICMKWMNRQFEYNGVGSPFPLDKPLDNQVHLDMIRQLNAYILEKHMYEDEIL